jgi:phosphoglycolate phosphatase
MIKFKEKKLIIFDLDGVLISSLDNMKKSWNNTVSKFSIDKDFKKYKDYIGKPFKDILSSLKIETKHHRYIEKEFKKNSIKNLNLIKFYPKVYTTLKYLKKNYRIAVLTSKDKSRTLKILKMLKIKFDKIQCPEKNYKGKPHPDLLIKLIKNLKIKKKNAVYIGDTKYDLLASRSAGIDFILAKYGFKIGLKKYKFNINKFEKLKKIF